MTASDQLSGFEPEENSLFKYLTRKGTTLPAEFFQNSLITPSGPAALPFFNMWIASYTSTLDMSRSRESVSVCPSPVSMSLSVMFCSIFPVSTKSCTYFSFASRKALLEADSSFALKISKRRINHSSLLIVFVA